MKDVIIEILCYDMGEKKKIWESVNVGFVMVMILYVVFLWFELDRDR